MATTLFSKELNMKLFGVFITLLACVSLNNGEDQILLLEPDCGIFTPGAVPRIINGTTTDISEHPWMAYILTDMKCNSNRKGNCPLLCGGTLITRNFVLSAGHCRFDRNKSIVYLGNSDYWRLSRGSIKGGISEVIIHPNYSASVNSKFDIALLRLPWRVKYTEFIRPICVTNYQKLLDMTPHMYATGWGKTEFGAPSRLLQQAKLLQYARGTCYPYFGMLASTQICAGSPASDTCGGDSGGPVSEIFSLSGQKRVVQLGITSFGDANCNGLGVYTNVMYFFDWISYNVRQSNYQTTPAPFRRPRNNKTRSQNPNRNRSQNNNHRLNRRS